VTSTPSCTTTIIGYGRGGWTWIGPVLHFMRDLDATTVIDYGCGKGTLARWMPPEYTVVNYDPVTFPDLPEPADFVVCSTSWSTSSRSAWMPCSITSGAGSRAASW
jgi:hypothetical protein